MIASGNDARDHHFGATVDSRRGVARGPQAIGSWPGGIASPCLLAFVALIAASATGCGERAPVVLEPVIGQVTFYGRPVVAELLFQPIQANGAANGRPSYALSAADGRYQAQFTPEYVGALPGRHRVTVTVFPFADEGEPRSLDEATRPFRRIVVERDVRTGSNEFHFLLTY